MFLLIVSIFIGLLLFGIGFILTEKNAPYSLSGYNSFSEEEKKQFDLKSFVYFFRNFHFILGGSIVLLSVLLYLIHQIDGIGFVLTFFPLIGYAYFIYKSIKLYPKKQRKTAQIALWILLGVGITVGIIMSIGFSSSQLTFQENNLAISGIYGETIAYQDIANLSLIQKLPDIKIKTNGFALQNIKKGYFKTKNGEKVRLILNSLDTPCLLIELKSGEKIYYSDTAHSNVKLYEDYLIRYKEISNP